MIVIGGGPGGSCAAGFLAKAGRRVLLLEKEHFPRFHIGESLLPYNLAIFEELGVMPTIRAAGFAPKYGAQFHFGDKSKELKFVFRNGRFTEHTEAFQVERSKFDHLLLQHASKLGADVREGVTVERTKKDADGVTVESRDEAGVATTFRAQFLVDASGRGNLTGNQQHLILIGDNAIRFRNQRINARIIARNQVGISLGRGKDRNVLHRPRTKQGNNRRKILDACRLDQT